MIKDAKEPVLIYKSDLKDEENERIGDIVGLFEENRDAKIREANLILL